MFDNQFIGKYRISSDRADWYGYGGGTYFVTICTRDRKHFFGKIVTGFSPTNVETWRILENVETRRATSLQKEPQMQLSPIGQYAHDQFANVSDHYSYADIPLFVIMPNHIHAVVLVDGENVPYQRRVVANNNCRDVACRVSTNTNTCRVSTNTNTCRVSTNTNMRHVSTFADMRQIANMQGWLSVVIGGLKSSITKFANENKIPFAWQSRFHDRIIRNQEEMNRMALYIEQNVAKWNEDELCQ